MLSPLSREFIMRGKPEDRIADSGGIRGVLNRPAELTGIGSWTEF